MCVQDSPYKQCTIISISCITKHKNLEFITPCMIIVSAVDTNWSHGPCFIYHFSFGQGLDYHRVKLLLCHPVGESDGWIMDNSQHECQWTNLLKSFAIGDWGNFSIFQLHANSQALHQCDERRFNQIHFKCSLLSIHEVFHDVWCMGIMFVVYIRPMVDRFLWLTFLPTAQTLMKSQTIKSREIFHIFSRKSYPLQVGIYFLVLPSANFLVTPFSDAYTTMELSYQ